MMEKKSLYARVMGKVQGVFFRASTKQHAESLGLTGWVRNEQDGAVTLMASGAVQDLEQMIIWLHKGPPAARVDQVDWAYRPFEPFDAFSVQRAR